MSYIRYFNQIEQQDLEAVGGKGLSLGLMMREGLPVPDGFCLTSQAFREARNGNGTAPLLLSEALRQELNEAYRQLGSGSVAVRSSATAEDGETTSFAGQQETILGVQGEPHLSEAVARCWRSWDSEPARAYREKQQVEADDHAKAVVKQR